MRSLVGWNKEVDCLQAVSRPSVTGKTNWPPDYYKVWRWRAAALAKLNDNPSNVRAAKAYYAARPAEFILDWMDTYDPRRANNRWVPFVLFEKQAEAVRFLQTLDEEQESGLVEKSRDMGMTWVACAYTVWCWLFKENDATGWGSRKETLVDKIGDPDSIFEKLRLILKRLPPCFMPKGFLWSKHAGFLKIINPENGSVIAGEAGDNIGRGGRKSRFFKDESAHYERPEKIEAALGDNTNVQIDISSVNGVGNIFHRRRQHGVEWNENAALPKGHTRVFVMDWRDHPLKTQEWYETRKAKYEREGLQHIFAQEVDRNYSAAVVNTIISYEWVRAAVDAHIHIPYMAEALAAMGGKQWTAGLDVADEGEDRNAITLREWVVWRHCEEWGERDPGTTARRAIAACLPYEGRINCQYDCIGVGSNIKSEYNRLTQDEGLANVKRIPFVPWHAGGAVLYPYKHIIDEDSQSPVNKDFFDNLKAQACWAIRTRFYKTFKAVTEGVQYDPNELISLDSRMPLLEQLCSELIQPRRGVSGRLKMIVDKKPNGTKSPNLADSGVQAFFPLPQNDSTIEVGSYGHD